MLNAILILALLARAHSIKDGTEVDTCDYPGVVAVVFPSNEAVVCEGIRVEGTLYVPALCGMGIEKILASSDLMLYYGDGTKTVTITKGSSGRTEDGIYQLQLATMETDCNEQAVIFDKSTMEVDTSTCELVGYGASTLSAKTYDGVLRAAPLTKSTSAPCCDTIFNSLNATEKGKILDTTVPLNCITSSGAGCGTGDLGAPIYCSTTSGQRVVMGLAASTPCASGGTFVAHDLTGSDPDFKFGIQQ